VVVGLYIEMVKGHNHNKPLGINHFTTLYIRGILIMVVICIYFIDTLRIFFIRYNIM